MNVGSVWKQLHAFLFSKMFRIPSLAHIQIDFEIIRKLSVSQSFQVMARLRLVYRRKLLSPPRSSVCSPGDIYLTNSVELSTDGEATTCTATR
jgi:hypothetical protein